MHDTWDPKRYIDSHSFVYELGEDLIELAAIKPNERVLDVGCGSGQLTARLAQRATHVLGIDSSPAMIETARESYPGIGFEVQDITKFEPQDEYDVVFSNATLHWVQPARAAARQMAKALTPGGRLVAEFGGNGNINGISTAIGQAMRELSLDAKTFSNPWFNPTVAEYRALLETVGLSPVLAELFPRPTKLKGADGLLSWLRMFVEPHLVGLDESATGALLNRTIRCARSELYVDGTWWADYVRLRVIATKPET